MTAVAYIRMSTCHPLRQIPANHITQQSDRIKAYAKRKGWKIAARYCDRKHDSAECTAFEQMVEDGLQRKFDMVIVDSIYGAGMDLESVKRVLLQTFHHAGISFAVVEDDFVSREKSIAEIEAYFQRADLELQKAYIQKRNIEKSQRLQWSDIKYGYRLLDSGELAIDMRTAPIVQRMFQMRLSGKTLSQIASTLNREGIPGPRGNRKPDSKWELSTINRILHSTAYVGYWYKTVQGKQVRLELEPIVSKEDYDAVQRICAPSGSDAGSQEKNNLMVSLVVYESSGKVLKTKKNCSGERYFYDKLNWVVGYDRHIPCDVIQRIAVAALENECRLARDMEKLLPEELYIRKQEVLTKLREEMRCQLEYVANALKTENNSRVVLDSEPIFQTFMETANDIEIAFSQKNPWIRLYANLELDSLDSNLAFRQCIKKIEVCRDGRILFVPKEEKWKQLLSQ